MGYGTKKIHEKVRPILTHPRGKLPHFTRVVHCFLNAKNKRRNIRSRMPESVYLIVVLQHRNQVNAVIGRSPRHKNVFFAFGHDHLGLTMAGITGKLIAELATGRPTTVDLAPFRPDRF